MNGLRRLLGPSVDDEYRSCNQELTLRARLLGDQYAHLAYAHLAQ
jgi:hypothetical protein